MQLEKIPFVTDSTKLRNQIINTKTSLFDDV